MIPLYDHIIELRAELRSCYLSTRECTTIKTELEQALATPGQARPGLRERRRGLTPPSRRQLGV